MPKQEKKLVGCVIVANNTGHFSVINGTKQAKAEE
jgi:hypothetical protein